MLFKHSVLWAGALGLILAATPPSFAQRGGHGGGGGGARSVGHAGGAIHASPARGISSAQFRAAPAHMSVAPRVGSTLSTNQFKSPATAVRPNTTFHPNVAGNLGRNTVHPGNFTGNAFHNNFNNFHNNNFNHNHSFHNNHHHALFSAFAFLGAGLFDYWPWGLAYPFYGYNNGSYYPYLDYAGIAPYGYSGGIYGGYDNPYAGIVNPYAGNVNPYAGNVVPDNVLPMPKVMDMAGHIDVILPDPNAELWFDGNKTATRGANRHFDTPDLQQGITYVYTIKATWMQNGQPVTQERVLRVAPGVRSVVDFTQPPKDLPTAIKM